MREPQASGRREIWSTRPASTTCQPADRLKLVFTTPRETPSCDRSPYPEAQERMSTRPVATLTPTASKVSRVTPSTTETTFALRSPKLLSWSTAKMLSLRGPREQLLE